MPIAYQNMPDIILRASVSRNCNFSCKYCPKGDWLSGGMENYAPDYLVGRVLSVKEYVDAIRQIRDGLGVQKISFTGGEPTLNAALPHLIKMARTMFECVETTTNASLMSNRLVKSFRDLDLAKVSVDSVDPHEFMDIVGIDNDRALEKVMSSIRELSDNSVAVALNVVVMKRNLPGLRKLVEFAKRVRCQVHLLDYVCYPSKRQDWEVEFVPMEFLAEVFAEEYGSVKTVTRYGCTFYSLDLGDIYVRFKDSMTATVRAKACDTCNEFCQEGPYGIKLAVEGWVTACPSVDPRKGVLVSSASSDEETGSRLATLRPMFTDTFVDKSSFDRFLRTWNLHPTMSRDNVRALFSGASHRASTQTHSLASHLSTARGSIS